MCVISQYISVYLCVGRGSSWPRSKWEGQRRTHDANDASLRAEESFVGAYAGMWVRKIRLRLWIKVHLTHCVRLTHCAWHECRMSVRDRVRVRVRIRVKVRVRVRVKVGSVCTSITSCIWNGYKGCLG